MKNFLKRGSLCGILFLTTASQSLVAQSPGVNASKTDLFTPNGTGKVLPGAPIQYRTTINNVGTSTASNLNFADAIPTNTTIVPGSVNVSPLANDDAYTTVVNTQLAAGSPTVLSGPVATSIAKATDNDREFLSDNFTISSFGSTSANGGSVTMVTSGVNIGSFTYQPAAGFVGADSFTYTLRDDGTDSTANNSDDLTSIGTVTINVVEIDSNASGMQKIWYLDSSYAGANGVENGTSTRPFNSLADITGATGPDAIGDTLFLSAATAYSGGATLLANQTLWGNNTALVIGGITLAPVSTLPVVTNASGAGITLAANNNIKGLTIGDTSTVDITGDTVGNLTITNTTCNGTGGILTISTSGVLAVDIAEASTTSATSGISLTGCSGTFSAGTTGSITGVSDTEINLSGGSATFTYSGAITSNTGNSISITNRAGGTATFAGLVNITGGIGISLTNNSGSTLNFTGGITANTGANAAFTATGGGTVNVTGTANTLTTTTATALNVATTTIGTSGLNFRRISSNGSTSGIILNTTGTSGGLTVTGDGGGTNNGSGGTVENCTGSGVMLTSTSSPSLNYMNITSSADDGISGLSVVGFSMNRSNVTNNGNAVNTDDNVDFGGSGLADPNTGLTGSLVLTNSTFTGAYNNQIGIRNNTGSASITITGCTVTGRIAENNNNDGVLIQAQGTSTITASIQSSSFTANKGDHFQAAGSNSGNLNVTFKNNTLTGGHNSALGQGITLNAATGVPGYNGTVNYDIDGNTINGAVGVAIAVVQGTSASSALFNGFIRNNLIGTTGVALSGSSTTHGMLIEARGNGTHTSAITGNTIRRCADRGIGIAAGDGSAVFNLTITANTITELTDTNSANGTAREAIEFNFGITSTNVFGVNDAPLVRVNLASNSLAGGTFKNGDIRMRKRQRARIELPSYAGTSNDTATVISYLQANNAGTTASCSFTEDVGAVVTTDGYFPTVGSVPSPTAPPVPMPLLFSENLPQPSEMGGNTASEPLPASSPTTAEVPAQIAHTISHLTTADLAPLVTEARARWQATGLTAAQQSTLDKLCFEISELSTLHLGQATGHLIQISPTAAGNSWFIDPTPAHDSEFKSEIKNQKSEIINQVDLLTTLIHEMGHALGLPDRYDLSSQRNIMYGHLTRGERRLPAAGEAAHAVPFRDETHRFLGATIVIGDLPPGKSVTIVGTVLVNDPANTQLITSQGTVTGSNITPVLTDDPATSGTADPTTTPVERPDAAVVSINRLGSSAINTAAVTWQLVLSQPVSGLTSSNFALVHTGLSGSPAITSVTATTSAPATTWDVTASTGTGNGNGSLGLNFTNDTSLSHDITNQPFTGQVYTVDKIVPSFTSIVRLTPPTQNTNADTLTFRATFSESVTGLNSADFTLTGSTATISSVTGTGPYDITLSGGDLASFDGTVGLNLAASQNITDLAGNSLPTAEPATDQTYILDNSIPTVAITSTTGNPAPNSVIPVIVTFSETVTGFDLSDITVAGSTKGNFAGTGATYTFDLTPTGAGIIVTADIASSIAQDGAGNNNTVATQFSRVISPTLSTSVATISSSATLLTLNGAGFSTTPANNTVSLSSGTATVTAATATQLTCSITGPLTTGGLDGTVTVSGIGSTATVQIATVADPPTITSPAITNLRSRSVTLGADVTADGGQAITGRGFVYSVTRTNSNPQIGGSDVVRVNAVGTTGAFTADVTGLQPATAYSFAAFAISSVGTTYTSPVSTFTTLSQPTISVAFGASAVGQGGVTTITYTVVNPNTGTALTGVEFYEGLPESFTVAANPGVVNTLGGTVTAVASSNLIQLTGGTLAAGATATVTVNIAPSTLGVKRALPSFVTSIEAPVRTISDQTVNANAATLGLSTSSFARQIISGTVDASDPTQTGRLNRFSPPSVPGTNKPSPGLAFTTGPRTYESRIIANTTATAQDVMVWLNTGNVVNSFIVAYLDSFDPLNIATNYLADAGSSSTATSNFGFTIPAGQSVVIVIHSLDGGEVFDYTLGINNPLTLVLADLATLPTIEVIEKSISITDLAAGNEGNSGTTDFTFTITRTGDTTGDVNMTYTVSGTAVNAADFGGTLPTGTATITTGSSTTTVTIPVTGDTTVEPNEAFTVTLTAPNSGYVIAGAPVTSTISNDDTATISIAKTTDGIESNTPTSGKLRVTQTAASSTDTTVAYTVTGTATSGTDFTALSGSVTILAGQTTADIDVTVLNDGTTLEPTETVIATVTGVTSVNNVTLGTPIAATINLTDDDTATVTLAKITDASESSTSALFRITQTSTTTVDTVITYSVGGTATSGSDFTAPTGSVTLLAGETIADISVAVANDTIVEATETIVLTLTGFTASDADVSLGTTVLATADLIDNDAANISIARINDGAETNSPTAALFRISQTAPSSSATTVSYSVTGSAISGTDFAALSGSVSIPAGSTTADISVSILNDAIVEATETITVTLTGFTLRDPDITLSSTPSATAAIVDVTDNDLATVSITKITNGIESASPTNALFRVTQSAVSSTATVIAYTTGGTATTGSDFTALSGSVTIPAGSTTADITATILNENVVESTETISLTLTSITSGDADITLLAPLTATADITDSDTSVITLAALSADKNEGTGVMTTAFTFSATLSNPVQGGFTLGYTTADGTAFASSDYLDNDSTLTFAGTSAESQTITVQVRHDDVNETDEAFTVALGAITNTTLSGSISLAGSPQTGTIRNDDAVTISIAATDATADENTPETGTYRLTRNGVLGTTTVLLAIDSSSTAIATDWTQTGATFSSLAPSSTGSIAIPDGQSFIDITLTPTADLHAEAEETVRLNLAADAAYTVGNPANATITIRQNDFLVINTNDAGEGTLRQAVLNANAIPGPDTISFDTAVFATPRTITLITGQIVISSSANVQGTGAALLTVDGNGASRIFNINSGASIRLSDMAVTNGNHSTSWGGAINVVNGSNVTLLRMIVSNSISQLNGGGIYVSGSTLNVVNSTISGNTATTIGGGAISTGFAAVGETINILNSTISGNTGPSGGAMQFGTNPSVNILHSTITNNTTTTSGGSVTLTSGSLTLSNSIIAANVNNTTIPDVSGAFTSAGGNLIGNVGTATGVTAASDITGTGTAPVNPLLGALTHNGGTTLTHAVLNGSRAINNGLVANLLTDTFDLDGDFNVTETLPVDQRGGTNLRQRGLAPDSGAIEAFAFEPTLTTATTNEDVQSASGLVITANTADGGLTTHYKITGVLNGTLFKNNGTTAIPSGSYITKTEGLAGLKFTPAANLNTTNTPAGFSFTAQAAVGTSASEERGTPVPVTLTVNAINDAPTVVAPGLSDQILTIGQNFNVPLSTAFTDIEGDLPTFTVQTNSDGSKASAVIIQDSVNLAGLASGTTSITILADDGQGGTVTDTFFISVGTVNPTPLQIGNTATLNRQTGLFDMNVVVTNTTPYPINGFRLRVNYNAYKAAHPSLILFNASSPAGALDVYLDYRFPVAVDGVVQLKLSFYTNNRRFPSPFVPGLSVESLGAMQIGDTLGAGTQPALARLPDRSVRLEFGTVPGKWYRVRYSADLVNWFTCELPVQATGNLTPWIDNGPPHTTSSPANEDRRFYLINEIPVP